MTQALLKNPAMRRAPKDLGAGAWARPDPVDFCLSLWKIWIHVPDRERGTQTMEFADRRPPKRDKDGNLVDAVQGGYEGDSDSDQARQDMAVGEAVNTMVSSLSTVNRWAIYRATGIATVWRFPEADYMDVAIEAREQLKIKMRSHLATATYFV